MKKVRACLLTAICILAVSGCGKSAPVLNVMVQNEVEDGNTKVETRYETVYENGKSCKTKEFDLDRTTRYIAEYGDFKSNIKDGKVTNTLEATGLTDDNGGKIEADEIMAEMMQKSAEEIDHDILEYDILIDQERYFAVVKLNVNLTSPCILYEYDKATYELKELCEWDGMDVKGVSLLTE